MIESARIEERQMELEAQMKMFLIWISYDPYDPDVMQEKQLFNHVCHLFQ